MMVITVPAYALIPIPGIRPNKESYAIPAIMISIKYGYAYTPTNPRGIAKNHQPLRTEIARNMSSTIRTVIFLFIENDFYFPFTSMSTQRS